MWESRGARERGEEESIPRQLWDNYRGVRKGVKMKRKELRERERS